MKKFSIIVGREVCALFEIHKDSYDNLNMSSEDFVKLITNEYPEYSNLQYRKYDEGNYTYVEFFGKPHLIFRDVTAFMDACK